MRISYTSISLSILQLFIIIFILALSPMINCCFATNSSIFEDAPVYNSPNKNDEKTRFEADIIDGRNKNFIERGSVVIKGIRGSAESSDNLSTGLSDGLSKVLEIEPKHKDNAIKQLPFPDRLAPIASEQTGLTSREQPSLYFYISGPYDGTMTFTLSEPFVSNPILSISLNRFPSEGIYGVRLSEYMVKLKKNVEYEWFITIIADPQQKTGDIYASATIKYVEATSDLSLELSKVSPNQKYKAYAKTGYWYDAIESLTQLIHSARTIKTYRLHRAALLKQVNLTKAAKYDLSVVNIPR